MWRTFVRTWWIANPAWPGGLEPGAGPRRSVRYHDTEEEARHRCAEYNRTHNPGRLSRKMEYEPVTKSNR